MALTMSDDAGLPDLNYIYFIIFQTSSNQRWTLKKGNQIGRPEAMFVALGVVESAALWIGKTSFWSTDGSFQENTWHYGRANG